jgi:hypothetical protein
MADDDRRRRRLRHLSRTGDSQPDDRQEGQWSRTRLEAMDRKFVESVECAIRTGRERPPLDTRQAAE